jgi:hypothetical protein
MTGEGVTGGTGERMERLEVAELAEGRLYAEVLLASRGSPEGRASSLDNDRDVFAKGGISVFSSSLVPAKDPLLYSTEVLAGLGICDRGWVITGLSKIADSGGDEDEIS